MLLSWGRELQFVCLACLPIPYINVYPFFFTFLFFYFMGYTCMEVRGKLTGAQISMSTMWDLGVKLSVQAWWWQTPLSTESSCQASTWCFNKNNVFLLAVSALGKLTSWTWHPSRAVWLSRQIRALSHDSPNRNQVTKIFFTQLSMLKRSDLQYVHTQIWSLWVQISVRQRKCWRENRSKGEDMSRKRLVNPKCLVLVIFKISYTVICFLSAWLSELCQPCPPCYWIARSHSSK